MRYLWLFFFLFAMVCHAQHEELLHIINSDESIEFRQQKIDSFLNVHKNNMPKKILADCYHDLGSKWYYPNWLSYEMQKDIDSAISVTQRAAELKANSFSNSLIKTLNNLGYFYSINHNLFKSIASYNQLVEIDTANEKTKFALRELGKAYNEIGDFHKALNCFNRVLSDTGLDVHTDTMHFILTHISIANTFSMMDFKEYSEEIKTQVIRIDSILNSNESVEGNYKLQLNQIEGNRLLIAEENFESAMTYHKKVLDDSIHLDSQDLASVYNSIAFSQLKLGQYRIARENLNKAIALDSIFSEPYENLGDWHLAQKEFEKGLWFYQKAIVFASGQKREIIYDDLISEEEMELSPNKISLLNHIVTKANGWLKYYEHDENKVNLVHALKTFDLADRLVDIIRSESTEQQSKLYWRQKGSSLYMKAVEACFLLDRPEQAFYFMERNKALLLLEDITNEQAKEIASLPDSIAQREFELKRAIFLAENEFQIADSSAEKETELKEAVYKSKRAYEAFADSLLLNFPNYANLKKKVDVLSYAEFKNEIDSDEVVLQYILNDEQGYGLASSANEIHFFEIEAVEELNENIVSLYGQLTKSVMRRNELNAYFKLSNTVFQRLLPERVFDMLKGKKVTVISDYILQQLPFETLVTNAEKAYYLIEDADIRYAYSMSYLNAKRKIEIHPEKELLGLAPVNFASLQLPDLAFSEEEVKEANAVFDGEILLREKATKGRLLDSLDDFRILHLSTHADIGERENHWIALNDEKLFLNEVYANKNQADMVVLSACNTSVGELQKGEGVMSLARGFFHSGAKSVVSSLWTTNDKASKDIVTAFYKELGNGLTKSAALRKAKIDYINRYRETNISPAHWGALIMIGDNSPIQKAGFLQGYLKWFILTLLVVGIVFVTIKKRRT